MLLIRNTSITGCTTCLQRVWVESICMPGIKPEHSGIAKPTNGDTINVVSFGLPTSDEYVLYLPLYN
jgi:hypothetical protein